MVSAKDRAVSQVAAKVVPSMEEETLQGFVKDQVAREATVYTDEAEGYG